MRRLDAAPGVGLLPFGPPLAFDSAPWFAFAQSPPPSKPSSDRVVTRLFGCPPRLGCFDHRPNFQMRPARQATDLDGLRKGSVTDAAPERRLRTAEQSSGFVIAEKTVLVLGHWSFVGIEAPNWD